MILAALLIGSVCFAQKEFTLSPNYTTTNPATAQRSDWVGNQSGNNVFPVTSGHAILIRGEQFATEYSAGNTITKVKFTTCNPANIVDENQQPISTYADYTNNNFTIKIYEGGVYSSEYTTQGGILYQEGCLGTVAQSQSYTQTTYGENIVELNEPYTIGSTNFWIAVECAGNTVFLCNSTAVGNPMSISTYQTEADPSISSQNYLYTSYEQISQTDYAEVVNNNYSLQQVSASSVQGYSIEIILSFFVEDGQAYVENSDLEAGFMDVYPNPTNYNLTSLTISPTADLHIYPYIINNGPDAVHPTGAVNISFTVNGVDPYGQAIPMQWNSDFGAGFFSPIQMTETEYGITFTAAELDAAQLPAEFDVCMTATYTGVDNNPNNNTACLHVTRQAVSVEENIAEAVSVYPNPANDMFTVANAEGATIVVVNSLGQVVASIENAASNQTIDASNFANGTYFVKVNENVIKINVVK